MPITNNYYVDINKLKAQAKQRGLTMVELAKGLGRSHGYFSATKRGLDSDGCCYPEPTILALKAIYNIDYEDIKGEPKRVNEPTPEPVQDATLAPIDLHEDIRALTQAVTQLGQILKASHDATFEHEQRVETMIRNALEPDTLYKSLFMPVFNAVRDANNAKPERRIDGTPNWQNRK